MDDIINIMIIKQPSAFCEFAYSNNTVNVFYKQL